MFTLLTNPSLACLIVQVNNTSVLPLCVQRLSPACLIVQTLPLCTLIFTRNSAIIFYFTSIYSILQTPCQSLIQRLSRCKAFTQSYSSQCQLSRIQCLLTQLHLYQTAIVSIHISKLKSSKVIPLIIHLVIQHQNPAVTIYIIWSLRFHDQGGSTPLCNVCWNLGYDLPPFSIR